MMRYLVHKWENRISVPKLLKLAWIFYSFGIWLNGNQSLIIIQWKQIEELNLLVKEKHYQEKKMDSEKPHETCICGKIHTCGKMQIWPPRDLCYLLISRKNLLYYQESFPSEMADLDLCAFPMGSLGAALQTFKQRVLEKYQKILPCAMLSYEVWSFLNQLSAKGHSWINSANWTNNAYGSIWVLFY